MDNAQDFNYSEQAGQVSCEASEIQKSENLVASFFDDCNEDERKIIDEFSRTLGIRDNDAIWAFVKVFFSINNVSRTLSLLKGTKSLTTSNNLPLPLLNWRLKRLWLICQTPYSSFLRTS